MTNESEHEAVKRKLAISPFLSQLAKHHLDITNKISV